MYHFPDAGKMIGCKKMQREQKFTLQNYKYNPSNY